MENDLRYSTDVPFHDNLKCEMSSVPKSEASNNGIHEINKTNKIVQSNNCIETQSPQKNKTMSRCSICNHRYYDDIDHKLKYHSLLDRPYECYVCHKNYKEIKYLRLHQQIHWNESNFVCHICGNVYPLSSTLKKHLINRHSNVRPHKCEHCSKDFKFRRELIIHLRTHTGEKPFGCSVCPEKFAALSSLRIHERRHTGEKPYICKYCSKSFSDSSTHRQHVRVHTGEKPYMCHLCGRRTAQAGNLKSHYRHYHKIVVKNVSMHFDK